MLANASAAMQSVNQEHFSNRPVCLFEDTATGFMRPAVWLLHSPPLSNHRDSQRRINITDGGVWQLTNKQIQIFMRYIYTSKL